MNEKKLGRKPNPNKKILLSVRVDKDILASIDKIECLTRTEAIENGLKLVLAYETKAFYKKLLDSH